uniref:Uncharacterized protein n=1 Tax=Physcomitrium patens TaxID=3218 RepID=A0A7I4C330_PHYPA
MVCSFITIDDDDAHLLRVIATTQSRFQCRSVLLICNSSKKIVICDLLSGLVYALSSQPLKRRSWAQLGD